MPTWCLCSCSSRLLSNSALRARVSVALLSSSSARCLQASESGNNGPLKEGLGRPGVAVRTARSGTWLPAGPVAPSLRPPHCRAAAAAVPGPDAPVPGAAQTCRTVRMLTPTVGGHGTQLQPHTRLWMASAGGSPCPHTGLALLSSTLRGEPGTNRSKPLSWLGQWVTWEEPAWRYGQWRRGHKLLTGPLATKPKLGHHGLVTP